MRKNKILKNSKNNENNASSVIYRLQCLYPRIDCTRKQILKDNVVHQRIIIIFSEVKN